MMCPKDPPGRLFDPAGLQPYIAVLSANDQPGGRLHVASNGVEASSGELGELGTIACRQNTFEVLCTDCAGTKAGS